MFLRDKPIWQRPARRRLIICEADGHADLRSRIVLANHMSGQGMSAEEIGRVTREGSSDEGLYEGGIGLRNVIRRVALATGGRGRVELESAPGAGMSVRIILPAGVVA